VSRLTTWGATAQEVAGRHPGDELLDGAVSSSTYAVTVHAEPAEVWAWLVQLGQGRGGMYSYEWLENLFGLDIHNAEELRPEWQRLAAGDQVRVVPPGRLGMPGGYAFRVARVEPPRALVLRQQPPEHPWNATWAFLVVPRDGGGCRLLARSRSARVPGWGGAAARVGEALMLPVVLLMTRAMLLGIKRRAERHARLPVSRGDGVDLYWLPLGAGGRFVRSNGRLYEALAARLEHRDRNDLYHAALEVHLADDRYVIEQAPAWNTKDPDRGVVREGPVGSRRLGRFRLFRYEVRRWRGGVIPDRHEAVDSPRRLSSDADRARQVLDLVPGVPAPAWGRDEQQAGEMWNSNSVVAWVLARSGHDTGEISPPAGGRAPGWRAGLAVAARDGDPAPRPAPRRRASFWKTTLPVAVYRLTRGRLLGRIGGRPVLLLETVGRRSGRRHTTPVQYVRDGESFVVVASNAGAPRPPSWLLNLRANERARVQVGSTRCEVIAREADGEERAALWRRLTVGNPALDDIARRAGRELPVVVLSRTALNGE
jgi:deazaflavin-dependent oxidoreductase (nitroreductase family)